MAGRRVRRVDNAGGGGGSVGKGGGGREVPEEEGYEGGEEYALSGARAC